MKQFLFFSAIAITFFMCNNHSGESRPAAVRSDTTNVVAYYKDFYDGEVKLGLIRRVVKDSFVYVYTDTSQNNKRKWSRDTLYIQTVYVPVDSASSRIYKIPIRDSVTKMPNYIYYPVVTAKRFVRSGWDHVDSTMLKGLKDQQ